MPLLRLVYLACITHSFIRSDVYIYIYSILELGRIEKLYANLRESKRDLRRFPLEPLGFRVRAS